MRRATTPGNAAALTLRCHRNRLKLGLRRHHAGHRKAHYNARLKVFGHQAHAPRLGIFVQSGLVGSQRPMGRFLQALRDLDHSIQIRPRHAANSCL